MVIQAQVGHMSKGMIDLYCHIADAAVHNAAQLIEQHNPDLLFQLGLSRVSKQEKASLELRTDRKVQELLLRYENPKGMIQ